MSDEKTKGNSLTQLLRVISFKREVSEPAEDTSAADTVPIAPSTRAMLNRVGSYINTPPDLAIAAFEHTDVGLAQISLSGNYVQVNDKLCQTLGYPHDKLVGMPVLSFVHEEDADRERAELARVLTGDVQRITAERRYVRSDGAAIWLRRSWTPITDASGERHFLVQSLVDVTESRNADEQLKKTNSFLMAVINHSPMPIYTEGMAGNVTSWNRACERLLGYISTEAMGQTVPFLIEKNASDYNGWRARVLKGEALPSIDYGVSRADSVRLQVSLSLSPINDGRGKPVGLIGMLIDVTESRRARAALETSEARFRRLTESAQDITCVIGPNKAFTYISASARPLLGYDPTEFIGIEAKTLIHQDDWPRIADRFATNSTTHELIEPAFTVELRIKHSNGAWRWFEAKFSDCLNDPNVGGILVNAREITDRKQAQERVQFLAFHDNLTGLPNRMLLQDRITQAIARAGRQNKLLAVLFVDLDNFKHVNDTLGHDAGDALLAQVAARLRSSVRGQDTIARQGGDEFIILLEDVPDPRGVESVASKVLAAMQATFKLPQGEGFVSSSVGIAMFPADGSDAATLLKNADTAMYHSKARGKNQASFFTSEMNAVVRRRNEIEQALRSPNLGDAFFLEFQPQVWLADGETNGMEALVRWRRENGDVVSPADFVPIAEESGLIHGLGEYVISEACHAASHWILNRRQIKRVSVNVTARELLEPTFATKLIEALDDAGLDPSHLELEISENNLMHRLDGAQELLTRFSDMGITLAIDDFGVGYSNLALLRRLPVSRIKLDRALVRDIEHDSNAEAIAGAIVSMAQSLGLETIAVGIESERQLQILKRLGCEMGQGYLFGGPKRPESV